MNFIYGISYEDRDLSSSSSYDFSKFNTNTGFKYELIDDLTHTTTLEYSLKDYTITDSSTVADSIAKQSGNNADILFNNRFIYNNLNSFIRELDDANEAARYLLNKLTVIECEIAELKERGVIFGAAKTNGVVNLANGIADGTEFRIILKTETSAMTNPYPGLTTLSNVFRKTSLMPAPIVSSQSISSRRLFCFVIPRF